MSAQDILVVAEIDRGRIADISLELLALAKQLAAETGGSVAAVLLGENISDQADALNAADRVLTADHPALAGYAPEPWLAALESVVRAETPRAVLIGSTSTGLDVGPLLAAKLDAPIVNHCRTVAADGDRLKATSNIYGGKLCADVSISAAPAILLVAPGAVRPVEAGGGARVVPLSISAPLEADAVRFEEMILPDTTDVDITQQEVLVAVGRGMQQEDDLEVAEELAETLGGAVAASRPIIDQGWLPPTRQVGKSGMTVKPKCFISLGISGAPEHVEGMKDSDLIIAVNTDPNAPIFEVADYGAVADLVDVAEALTETIKGDD